jgi:hypothetical protein
MKRLFSPEAEAAVFSKYLIGYEPTAAQVGLYKRSVLRLPDDATCAAALQHPLLLPYLDAYDAFFRSTSPLRQRLYLMFSILEASPEHTELFLPRQRSGWYVLAIAFYGARGVCRLVIGTVIVKTRGW